MTRVVLAILSSALLTVATSAQQPSSDSPAKESPPKTLTLTGCVEKSAVPNKYTIADLDNGKYEVSGSDIKRYLGKRVQVAGTPGSTKFRVKGGLWPTPNVAAQGGATMDPAKAAIAAQPGGGARGTGDIDLPTLKVRAVRTLDGGCK